MKRLHLILLAIVLSLGIVAPFAISNAPVRADVFGGVCQAGQTNVNPENDPSTSAVCKDKTSTVNPLTGPQGILMRVSMIIAFVAGAVALIMIIISGAQMISSGGDANKVKSARTKLVHSLTGLVIIGLAQTIIVLIINLVLN